MKMNNEMKIKYDSYTKNCGRESTLFIPLDNKNSISWKQMLKI